MTAVLVGGVGGMVLGVIITLVGLWLSLLLLGGIRSKTIGYKLYKKCLTEKTGDGIGNFVFTWMTVQPIYLHTSKVRHLLYIYSFVLTVGILMFIFQTRIVWGRRTFYPAQDQDTLAILFRENLLSNLILSIIRYLYR